MTSDAGHPRVFPDALPVTGAWQPGHPVGHRQFITLTDHRPVALEGGGALREVTLAYETWGTLAADGSASRRSDSISFPHALQVPYVPSAMRLSASVTSL